MAKNFIQEGDTLTLTAPYDTVAGSGALVGNIFGVSLTDVLTGAAGSYATEGVWTLPKLSTDVIGLGSVCYWDDSETRVTATRSGNFRIGVAQTAVGNPSSTVNVRLDNNSTLLET